MHALGKLFHYLTLGNQVSAEDCDIYTLKVSRTSVGLKRSCLILCQVFECVRS